MEPLKLGQKFRELDKKPVPEEKPGFVGPAGTLTAEVVKAWDGEEGAIADLVREGSNIAESLCKTGAVFTDGFLDPTLVFVHEGKLFKSPSHVLSVLAPKLFNELRGGDSTIVKVKVVLKESKASRRYYNFEVERE